MDLVPDELEEQASRWDSLARRERIDLAKQLRACGLSLGEVAGILPMSKPTLSVWCREVALTESQRNEIKVRRAPRRGTRRDTQWRRRAEISGIETDAREFAARCHSDAFFVGGIALYWAEGSKTTRRLQMANADPRLLRFFIEWVRAYCLQEAEFVMHINLHADNDPHRAMQYWAGALPIDRPRFTKPFIKPDGTGHRKNHLAHGVCRVTVMRSTDLWLRTMAWIDEIADRGWFYRVATLPPGR